MNFSTDSIIEKFINTTNSIAMDLSIITFSIEIRKLMFRMSHKIYCLQKVKHEKFKLIKDMQICKYANDSNKFTKIEDSYNRQCELIHKKCNEFRKKEYLYWIKRGWSLALKNDSRKVWKWVKKNEKINNQSFTVSLPIKNNNNNNEFISSADEKLKTWHSHYKFLGSDSSGHSLSKDFWKDSDTLRNLGIPRQQEWEINQGISDIEISKAISSIPDFKACDPEGIPMEFFKALIPCKNDSEESRENNSNISYGFKCLKALINRIWNGDFLKSWNNSLIVSIHKKDDPSDCNNYRGISLTNNELIIIEKIIANRISKLIKDL